ncbi:MAG: Zn-dependent alcohol dehydrogenase [Acidimicrobiales bacterium]|nr:Zn-dependent alcohol dehydrogenase [Acidimicrobiales bacterium]
MRAAVLNSCPGELEIEDVEIDKPGPREVLIHTVAAGLCHSDLHFMEGKYPAACPTVLGHESAGIVEAVGDDVTYVKPGDHVVTCLSVFCGECEFCLTGRMSLCQAAEVQRPTDAPPRLTRGGQLMNQFINVSSFAEQLLVHEHAIVKIPEEIPLESAALLGCGATTGLGAVLNTAKVRPGSTVAVIGCGGIGLNCIQGAALAGARRIIAVDMSDYKLDLARQFGATDLVDVSAKDAVGQIMSLTGDGVDYSFEAIGLKQTAEQAFNILRRGGTATIIGMIPFGVEIELPGFAFLMEKKLQGSAMGSNRFRVDIPQWLELYQQGRLKFDELVSRRIKLDQINEGFEAMKSGEVARSIIVFDS